MGPLSTRRNAREPSALPVKKIPLIVCYGNELRGDDGAGPAVGRLLQRRLSRDEATVFIVHQLLPEVAEAISRASSVIFIDAGIDVPPGSVQSEVLAPQSIPCKAMGHHQSPAGLLGLAVELYGHAPPAILHTIGGKCFSAGEGLSDAASLAVTQTLHAVVARVRNGRHSSCTA